MLATPHDIIATPDQVQALFKEIGSKDKRLNWYSRSYHLLLHDVQHEKVMTDVQRWLNKQSHELRKTDRRRMDAE
jgi:esterase/lipase